MHDRLTLAVVVLSAATFAACIPAREQPIELQGVGERITTPFALRGGYYVIRGEVSSTLDRPCYYWGLIEAPGGRVAQPVAGPLVADREQATWKAENQWIGGGEYHLRVESGCGQWRVEVARQALFDEASKAKAEGRPQFIQPGLADLEEQRMLPPPLAIGGLVTFRPTSLPTPVQLLREVLVRARTSGAGVEVVLVEAGRVLYVATDSVLLRVNPSGGIRSLLDSGDLVMLTGSSGVGEGHQWVEVVVGDVTGWVAADLLSSTPPPPSPTAAPTPTPLPPTLPRPTAVSPTSTSVLPTAPPGPSVEATPDMEATETTVPEITPEPVIVTAVPTLVPTTSLPATSVPTAAPTTAPTATAEPTPEPTVTPPSGTNTPPPATNTPLPATNTLVSATNTPVSGTNTPGGSTNTPSPATNTPGGSTNTPVSATSTLGGPTNTPVSATNTPGGSTSTPVPATNTPVPPTNTTAPAATVTNQPATATPS